MEGERRVVEDRWIGHVDYAEEYCKWYRFLRRVWPKYRILYVGCSLDE